MAKQIQLPVKYQIPSNWTWVDMGEYVTMKSGYPFDSKRFSAESENRQPLIRIRDVVKGETQTFTDEDCPDEYIIHAGEILIGMDGDFNAAKWRSEKALLNQRVCCIATKSPALLNDYLYYYLPDPLKKINNATPSVTVKHLSTKTLEKTPLPLPPLAEQQRIVDRIESLFAKLDEAKEKAQQALESFEIRKAAMFKKAFSGDLTRKWREMNSISTDWKRLILQDVLSEKPRNGYSPKPVTWETSCKSMTLSAVTSGVFQSEYCKYIDEKIDEDSYLWLEPGDILIQRANSLDKVGTSAIYTAGFHEFIYPDLIMKAKVQKQHSSEFIAYQLKTDSVMSYLRSQATGTAGNMPKINQKVVSSIPIVLPPIEEQNLIVSILDDFLSREVESKEKLELVLEQIDLLKKSILAKAFRGELGTNDPAEACWQ